jgi:outer membrane protein assembly factor BamB
MNERTIAVVTAAACGIVGGACLGWWFAHAVERTLVVRRADPQAEATARTMSAPPAVRIGDVFTSFDREPAAMPPGAWPRFRGADFDNICRDGTVVRPDDWDADGPAVLWSVALGEGYAGPAVNGGRVYLLDYDEEVPGDVLRCFALADGTELWRRGYVVRVKRNHGMSRTVPAVTDDWVVTIGPRCHVMCVDAATGDFRWGLDLVRDYGAKEPMWYAAQCPLIDDGIAVLAPGGPDLLLGVDCASGAIVWRTPNPRGWDMSHASIIPMTFAGRRMYVYPAIGGVVGVAADGPDRGTVLWETTEWDQAVVAPSPVPLPGGRLLITSGYGSGSRMFQLEESDGGVMAIRTLRSFDRKVFACEQHTPIAYRDHLFTVLPSDAGPLKQQLVCMDLDGNVRWTSGPEARFGLGPFLIVDAKILVLSDDGWLTVAEASLDAYVPLSSTRVLHGKEAWAPMAPVEGRLLLRDSERMVCLDISGGRFR